MTAYRSRAAGQPSRNLHAITGGIAGCAAHDDHRDLRPAGLPHATGMTRRTWEDFSMARRTGTSRTLISSVAVAVAIFAAVMAFESRSMSFDEAGSAQSNSSSGGMAGMNMSGSDPAPTPKPTPSMAADMPGMDMSGTEPTPTPTPSMAADMPGMDMSGGHEHGATTESVSARPLAPVLGTFGGGTSAVLLAAGFLRRKDRAANQARNAATAARRGRK